MAYFFEENIPYNSTVYNFEDKYKIFKYSYLKNFFVLDNSLNDFSL